MPGLNFAERVVRLHETLTRPRLAHVAGFTATKDIAVFSQLLDREAPPTFQILAARRGADGAFASTHGLLFQRNIVWTPDALSLTTVDFDMTLPLGEAAGQEPIMVDGYPLELFAPAPVETVGLPATPQALQALLRQQGNQ